MGRRKRMKEIRYRLNSILYVIGEYEYTERKYNEVSYKAAKLAFDDLVGQFERSEIVEVLRKFFLDTDKNDEVRCGAARVLGTLRASESVGDLEGFLDSGTLGTAAGDAITQILGKPKEKKEKE